MSRRAQVVLRSESGMALVITLLVVALLTTLFLEFSQFTRAELNMAGNFRDGLQAAHTAQSGIALALALLREDARQGRLDTLKEIWAQELPPIPFGGGTMRVEIVDESRKLNVNGLLRPSGAPNSRMRPVLERLMEVVGLDPHLVDALVDWTDPNTIPELHGAEEEYYQSLPEPYHVKNASYDTLDELRLTRGVTAETVERLRPHLWAGPAADTRVNINTATAEVLQALDPRIDAALARKILAYREQTPFRQPSDLGKIQELVDIYPTISPLIDVRSTTFHLTATGEVNRARQQVQAIVERGPDRFKVLYWREG